MENAVEALKMAGFMLLFIIALSITMITLTQAKTTADSLVKNQDRQQSYQYIEVTGDLSKSLSRTVTLADIIPTLYRYAQEDYAVQFYTSSGSPLYIYESGQIKNGVPVKKNDLDLDTEHWIENGETRYEDWRGNTTKIKQHVDDVVEYLLANYKNSNFEEKLGTTEDYEESQDTNELVPDINKQYKRIITYTLK
ncbi:MAG: hypothetical protein BHV96_05000 [Clostridium sp. CAG:354_28_25]|jgi:hypothetical protein|uniref:hypothetical protein n=1 Tax=Candidatus Merdicola sp. TaxID=3085652 RepID=UPI00096738CC|nr:MAG: hypothetical protein BHV96_05000 [Clostridium sp. CAG:354_28_25]